MYLARLMSFENCKALLITLILLGFVKILRKYCHIMVLSFTSRLM